MDFGIPELNIDVIERTFDEEGIKGVVFEFDLIKNKWPTERGLANSSPASFNRDVFDQWHERFSFVDLISRMAYRRV